MKIFVTGHLGFLGSNFLKSYGKEYELIGYDIAENDNLLDYENLKQKVKGCDIVVHLAAIPKPIPEKTFSEYMQHNVQGTENIFRSAEENGVSRVIYASSTTIYGIEKGIPFKYPIHEDQKFLSQYIKNNELKCRDCDFSYHISKVMAEQICAWYGLRNKMDVISLRFAPIDKVFLGTSVSLKNATHIIDRAIKAENISGYEAFNAVDPGLEHISCEKAQKLLAYTPKIPIYSEEQLHSSFSDINKYL